MMVRQADRLCMMGQCRYNSNCRCASPPFSSSSVSSLAPSLEIGPLEIAGWMVELGAEILR